MRNLVWPIKLQNYTEGIIRHMTRKYKYDIIVIGGSAGSIPPLIDILKSLPDQFNTPILLIIHRMKNTNSNLNKLMARGSGLPDFIEPEDKESIKQGHVYLAPQNYHVLVELDHSFGLDYSEPVNFSRPSIDVSFESVATVYKARTLAILLSGANKDGALGIKAVIAQGGTALVQSPDTSDYPTMPNAAIKTNPGAKILSIAEIITYLLPNKLTNL